MPIEVSKVLLEHFQVEPELLFAIPEHQVTLPGGGKASQNDLFALLGLGAETAAMTVEGKVEESFDKTLAEWRPRSTEGRTARFAFLTQLLGLPFDQAEDLRYQLFHRAVSAVLEARRFRSTHAIMLVHSYSPERRWFGDFAAFVKLFGRQAEPDRLVDATLPDGMTLHLGWICGNPNMLTRPDGRVTLA